jgi:uncharacterized membrane protein YeiH
MDLIYTFDLAGTFVFAISGAITAIHKKFDVFGSTVIAFVTALGGGTLRDVLIGSTPVGWMLDTNYLFVIGSAVICSYLLLKPIQRLRRTMFLFDTIGISLFTVMGLEKTLSVELSMAIAVMMGTVSAVFGGVIRDILCNEVPLIFRKEIYATACIGGGLVYLIFRQFEVNYHLSLIFTAILISFIRIMAVRKNWSLRVNN